MRPQPTSEDETPTPETPVARVLVVDDDPRLRRLVHDNLVLEGLDVRAAADVPAARAVLRSWMPDLLVLDVMMPGGSGLDVVRHLQGTRCLVVSAFAADTDQEQALAAGAAGFVSKPFDPDELSAVVAELLADED